jgi:hypothetical protein
VALRSIERTIVGLSMSLDWLSKQMRTRISVITASPRETEMTEYLDIIQDEREYTEQEISTQISLHNELYKVLAQKTSIEQANSVNQLTLLATFFLPLSLAAAILLMQTRFADLGVLLYDFLGVMVILIALALLVAGFNAYGRSYYDDFLHEVYFALRAFPAYPRRITIFWSSLWISASLVSFLLGMLKSVDLGGTVLGYEAAAIVGLWLASLPAFFLFVKLRQY